MNQSSFTDLKKHTHTHIAPKNADLHQFAPKKNQCLHDFFEKLQLIIGVSASASPVEFSHRSTMVSRGCFILNRRVYGDDMWWWHRSYHCNDRTSIIAFYTFPKSQILTWCVLSLLLMFLENYVENDSATVPTWFHQAAERKRPHDELMHHHLEIGKSSWIFHNCYSYSSLPPTWDKWFTLTWDKW